MPECAVGRGDRARLQLVRARGGDLPDGQLLGGARGHLTGLRGDSALFVHRGGYEQLLLRLPDHLGAKVKTDQVGGRDAQAGERAVIGQRAVEVGAGVEHPPAQSGLMRGAVHQVAQVDPVLVRHGGERQRAQRHALQATGQPGVDVAAGLAVGVAGQRERDRRAVPVRDLGAVHQLRVAGEVRKRLRHQEARAVVLPVLLEQHAEKRERPLVRPRQHVVGVQVAQLDEDPQQFGVELGVGQPVHPVAQQLEPLRGLDRVHGAFVEQVHVHRVDQQGRLIEQRLPVGRGQGRLFGDLTELRHRPNHTKAMVGVEGDFRRDRHRAPPQRLCVTHTSHRRTARDTCRASD